jgi:O-antigen/teichoic acid export membrane protein
MFEYFKERRLAAVFFSTLMVLFGLLALGALVGVLAGNNTRPGDWAVILMALGFFLVVLIVYGIWQWQRRGRMGRYKSTPLSDDERVKARRKLAVKPNFKKR